MKFYQSLLAAGLATLLSVSPVLAKHKKESTNYPTRTECNQVLDMNPGLIIVQSHYCISQTNLKRLSNLAIQDKCTKKGPEFISDYDAKIENALKGADTEKPKYIVTLKETLNYEKAFPDLQKECVENLEKEVSSTSQKDQGLEVSASSAAPVAGSTVAESKEAKAIPEGMVGIGGYIATQGGAVRLNALAGVRAGKTELKYENGLCTLVSFSPSTQDELKALEQVLIESSPDNNSAISDENIKKLQLKMCCDNYQKENKPVSCDKFKK